MNRATIAREMAHLPEAAKVIDGVFYRLGQVLQSRARTNTYKSFHKSQQELSYEQGARR